MMKFAIFAGLLFSPVVHADLVATFTRDGKSDSRIDRFPALSVEAGEPATPFLTAGKFDVTWKGKLVVPQRQRLIFSFEGQGTAVLKISGKEVLSRSESLGGEGSASTRLNPGEHEIELTYSSLPDGQASLRLFWQEASFVRQTIPASAFKAEATEATILGHQQRRGRELFANQSCAKCHGSSSGFGAAPMPEMAEVGPILFGTGDRTSEAWLRRWISEPHAIKPSTSMPDLVDASTEEGRQQASDLAAYLVGLKTGAPTGPAVDPEQAKEGGVHFHELGCVACHHPPGQSPSDSSRVPLNNVASKYLPGALVAFLKAPEAYHPFTKMPNFRLSDSEASAIASFLTQSSTDQETKVSHDFPAGDATRGAKVAEALQCGVCHPGMPMSPQSAPPSLDGIFKADWTKSGCVAPPEKRAKAPHLNLTEDDRLALVAFAKTGASSLSQDNAAEYATRQIQSLRCTACHALDSQPALLASLHSETETLAAHISTLHERVDQSRPPLTFTGEMLHTAAIEEMLSGVADPRPRLWLAMRMPGFASRASQLAKGISKQHGLLPAPPASLTVDPSLAAIGKNLIEAGGFGCNTCHGVGDQKPTAAFEVEGIHFNLTSARIREDYFHRWMDNPQSVTPGTKMPRYSEANKSQRTDVFEGDAKKQFEAIWHYLHSRK